MSMTNVARDAFETYHSGDFAKCSKHLEQIGSFKNAFDVKVTHNTLLNEYFKSGNADPQHLLTQLTQAADRAREKDKKEKGRRKRDEDDEDVYREDDDLYVLRYNQALLCVQLRQYAQARLILEELFDNIEPIDDYLAIKICFLLLELLLLQREPEQAVAILSYLEKPNAFLTVLRRERPAPKVIETRSMEDAGEGEDGEEEKREGEDGADAKDAIEAVVAAPEVKDEPKPEEGPLPSIAVGAFLPQHGRAPDNISRAEFRFYCLMYRARLAMALKNMKAAKKDSKSALELLDQELSTAPLLTPHAHTTGSNGPSEEALKDMLLSHERAMVNVHKAYFEYSKQNVRKAVKLLSLCRFNFAAGGKPVDQKAGASKGTDDDGDDRLPTDFHPAQDDACASVFFNNMGCIHFMMHKPNLAAYYFQKSLRAKGAPTAPPGGSGRAAVPPGSPETLLSGKAGLALPGVAVTRHWLDRRIETVYNAGLQMLMSNRPGQAYKCFEQCTPVFRNWPRLWIRLAECCIEMYQQSVACSADGMNASGNASTWSRAKQTSISVGGVAGAGSLCAAMGASAVGSGASRLACGAQGSGHHRRWLLTTDRNPLVGKLATGDDIEAKAGEQRTGPAGAPAPSGPVAQQAAKVAANGSDGEAVLGGEDALMRAVMCLKNVLVLTAPVLHTAAAGSEGADAGAAAGAATPGAASTGMKAAKATSGSSSTKPSGSAAPRDSRHQAKDLAESEASLLEDSALLKLSYVCLCQHDHSSAMRYSRRLLEKNNLLPQSTVEAGKEPGKAAEEAEESKKSWTFQAHNLPHSKDSKAIPAKWPSSMGAITTGTLYATEALLLAGKSAEAQLLFGTFHTNSSLTKGLQLQGAYLSEHERGTPSVLATAVVSHEPGVDKGSEAASFEGAPPALCGGLHPLTSVGGLTPPSYLVNCSGSAHQGSKERDAKKDDEKEKSSGKDGGHASIITYEPSVFPPLGDMQCTLYTNVAAMQCQDGNFDEAQRSCEKALQIQPRALAPLKTLVYLLLRKGESGEALRRLKESRPQK
eukprot:TRINITY_DN36440_c0_g2_i1.p1 TRINITY_DN36440_c0_g2~~TRINITY_DN36440_c0_g2_i1.p1  ORF type:complete len:1041 (-),score=243.18 TRINITY_DN36440_c0_g2_i1:40-3162(-)